MDDLQTNLTIREMLATFLQEDVGAGDITSDTIIPRSLETNARIICKAHHAIVAGLEEASILFDICGCNSQIHVDDGSKVTKGIVVMTITGNARSILKAERTALNLIMRMSGIATETQSMADLVQGVRLLATRKTAPGLRLFDKKAVTLGGGATHRMRLDDMVLIKDNHFALTGAIEKCVSLAKKNVGSKILVECEVRSKAEAIAAILAGADIVMLDNFTPKQAQVTMRELGKVGLRNKSKIEISGGINRKNIRQYAKAKPDFISLGYVTHSIQAVDFSLDIMK